jgi:hypothetical protein
MSIRQNFPTTPPSLVLDFANSKTLDPRITFSRTTTATRMNELGLIETVSADVARFDHKYEDGVIKSLGLLVEESRSNLFNHTEDFTQLPVSGAQDGWFRGRVGITTESITAPDGSSGVSLLTENNTSFGEHYVTQEGFNYTSGVTYTWSWYVKPNGRDNVYCKVYTNFNNTQVILNLETSSEYYLTGTTFDNITNTKLPNGWYRVSFTSTAISTGAGSVLLGFAQSETVRSYTGDGSSGMYYWGAQVEAGAFPTSYIPTEGSTKTRAKEYPTISGTDFTDFYNSSEGTIYVKYNIEGSYATSGFNRIFEVSDGGSANRYAALLRGTNQDIYDSGWNSTLNFNTSLITFGDFYTYIMGYKENDFQRYTIDRNGNIDGNTDTSVTVSSFTPTELNIGYEAVNDNRQLNGHISKLSYYPLRLPNNQLQNLIL